MLPKSPSLLISRPIVNGENNFVLSPMNMGIRMTSQIELAGLKTPPNYNRIRKLLPMAKQMLPKIDTQENSVWLGNRPLLLDSLPVIGYSTRSKNVLYAFSHQHLGMTLAAVTGDMLANLFDNKKTRVPIFPYRAHRFNML